MFSDPLLRRDKIRVLRVPYLILPPGGFFSGADRSLGFPSPPVLKLEIVEMALRTQSNAKEAPCAHTEHVLCLLRRGVLCFWGSSRNKKAGPFGAAALELARAILSLDLAKSAVTYVAR